MYAKKIKNDDFMQYKNTYYNKLYYNKCLLISVEGKKVYENVHVFLKFLLH